MSTECIVSDLYSANGFAVIGTQLEHEMTVETIIKKMNQETAEREQEQKKKDQQEAYAKVLEKGFDSVPTSSTHNMFMSYGEREPIMVAIMDTPRKAIAYSYTLSDLDYRNVGDTYGLPTTFNMTEITRKITPSINTTIKGTRYTSWDDLTYTDGTLFTRNETATLLPLDVLTLYNTKVAISFYVVEVYNKTNNRIVYNDGCEVTAENGIVLGGNYNSDAPITYNDTNSTYMSTAKDTHGNVYVLKKNTMLSNVIKYLHVDSDNEPASIEPTNMSEATGKYNDNPNYECGEREFILEKPIESYVVKKESKANNIPDKTGNSLCAFSCYIRGFLIFNTNTIDSSVTTDNCNATAIWIDTPVLFKVEKSDSGDINDPFAYKISIGNMITTTDNAKLGSLKIKLNNFNVNYDNDSKNDSEIAYLPIESGFYKKNFIDDSTTEAAITNVNFRINTISNYY